MNEEVDGVEHRVFKQNVNLVEGETYTLPENATPLTVIEKSPTEVLVWYTVPANAD